MTALPTLEEVAAFEDRVLTRLSEHGFRVSEGSCSAPQFLAYMGLAQTSGARSVAEVGFNAGLSSCAFLLSDEALRVVSFDLGEHEHVSVAWQLIDEMFPGRHELVVGDSRSTLAAYAKSGRFDGFDLVLIDGGHDYEIARSDVLEMRALCRPGATIVMDDIVPWKNWGRGPTRAWTELVAQGVVRQDALIRDGVPVGRAEPPADRIWAVGHYEPTADH